MNGIEVTPFLILVDSREKAPWQFKGIEIDGKSDNNLVVQWDYSAMRTGDYTIEGHQSRITIERKSAEDAYGTFGGGRERFERELERMAAMEYACVVIESDWTDLLLTPPKRSKLHPKTISRSIIAWSQRYGVHFFALPGRMTAEKFSYRILERWWKDHEHES